MFFEYSLSQSAYLCFDPSTSKIFVSHHVKFVESVFPYKSLHAHLSRPNSTTVDTWVLPVLTVSFPSPPLLATTPFTAGPPELPPCTTPSLPATSQQQSSQPASTSTQSTSPLPVQSSSQIPLTPCPTNHHRMTT